ncbi:MAG: hypothetical protein A2234_08295 [Elusimicrobia bacterium RIFOXYA2_FULL_58_8]|nr:MAG: hypothetical protein A2285_07195 [Elusimicrobia bacterium RIFOXYA12_FULL_57_11]OGS17073.1 MAG: hypothetical protein A2234_08295 [Elusimicrobia bacterium RIFOXYA2_FULL_58_8]
MYKYLTAACFAVVLSACASAATKPGTGAAAAAQPPRPAWVDGVSYEYPRSRFLTGVSSADDISTAKDRARAEISKIFSTRINLNTSVVSSDNSYMAQGKAETSSSQNVMQNVRAVSQKELEGVEIAQTWRDGASGQYYALAVLDRARALAALEEKTGELDVLGRELSAQLAAAAEKLQKAKHALQLMDLLKTRDALAADRRVLDPAGAGATGLDTNAIRREASKALAALDVVLLMSGDRSDPVTAAIIKAFNGLGMDARTAPRADGADLAAECTVELAAAADPDEQSRWRWRRGTAAVVLKDVKTAKVFLTFDAAAKEASATDAEARLKTEKALGKKIAAEISRGITTHLEQQQGGPL